MTSHKSKSKLRLNLNSLLLLSNQLHLTTMLSINFPSISSTQDNQYQRRKKIASTDVAFIFERDPPSLESIGSFGWALRVERSQIRRLSFFQPRESLLREGSRGNKIRAPNFRGRGSRIRRPIELVDDHSKWNILSFECESGVSILRATNGLVEALNAIYYP